MLVAASSSHSSSPIILVIYALVFGGIYFFWLRPRSQKQKAARVQARQVEVGERAQTIGGLIGTIVSRTSEVVTLRTASGVELEFVPSAIARRVDPVVSAEDDSTSSEHENGGPSHEGDDK